nr:transposase domain-containing protein [Planomonospora venezuelensis]
MSISVLTSAFPVSLLDEVIRASGCADRRRRALPAHLTMYYVLALCMFPDRNYDQVMRLLLNGLAWRSRRVLRWEAPSTSAISRARARLGAEPLRALLHRVAVPTPRAHDEDLAGLWPVTMDDMTLAVPGTPDNAAFGRPDGKRPLPCVRVVAVAENGTHTLVDATFAGSAVERHTLAARALRRLGPGALLLARSGPEGFGLWRTAAATGAHLLWGIAGADGLAVEHRLGDGSYLSRHAAMGGAPVRVVPRPGTDWLVTTLTDPGRAPVAELSARYAGRWDMAGAMAWAGRCGPAAVLRSRSAETVAQEVWALLCVYQAMCALALWTEGSQLWPAPPARGGEAGRSPGGEGLYRCGERRQEVMWSFWS